MPLFPDLSAKTRQDDLATQPPVVSTVGFTVRSIAAAMGAATATVGTAAAVWRCRGKVAFRRADSL